MEELSTKTTEQDQKLIDHVPKSAINKASGRFEFIMSLYSIYVK